MRAEYFSKYALRNLAGRSWPIYRVLFNIRDHLSPPHRETNRQRTHRNYYVIDSDPLIIVTSEGIQDIIMMSELIGDRSAHFLAVVWWSIETRPRVRELHRHYVAHQEQYPMHKITFACNTNNEFRLLQEFQLPAIYLNQNSLLDESIYRVCTDVEKRYDVIYNARIVYGKRHFLLQKCSSIAFLAGLIVPISDADRAYLEYLANLLPDAVILNGGEELRFKECVRGNFPQFAADEISPQLSLAHVGVILSLEEGACYASAEYLLSGLPVVSTKSYGGRDVFFDSEYVTYVSPAPNHISHAVHEMKLRSIAPDAIRRATLEKMHPHRVSFRRWLLTAYRAEGRNVDVSALWPKIFINKMIKYAQPFPVQFIDDIAQKPVWK